MLLNSIFKACLFVGMLTISTPSISTIQASEISQDIQSNRAAYWLKEGTKLYQQGNYSQAADAWNQASQQFNAKKNILGQALALSNVATAYSRLGQSNKSQQAIEQSLDLLVNLQADTPEYWDIYAKVLNTQGNWQWMAGLAESALSNWQTAEQYYLRADRRSGIIKARINQAKALQFLGRTIEALKVLQQVKQDLQQQPDPELKAIGLRHLGRGLRNVGRLESSEAVLLQSTKIDRTAQDLNLAWLELGNTRRKIADRAKAIGKEAKAEEYFALASAAYERAQMSVDDSNSLQAQLNQLSLFVQQGDYNQAIALAESINPNLTSLAATRANIQAQLNYVQSLTCLKWSAVGACKDSRSESELLKTNSPLVLKQNLISILERAIAQSGSLEDKITTAQAIGQLARVHELEGNWLQAQSLTQQALLLLEGLSAKDVAYSLEWQQGRILQQQGQTKGAIAMYRLAITSLEQVRSNILFIDRQVQFSFRDRIEPVYRQYAELLLSHERGVKPSQENLRQAIVTIDALQLAELENFLGCELKELVNLDKTTVDRTAARIYPIVLSDRLATIVEIPGQPLFYAETLVARSQIASTAIALQDNLAQPGRTANILQHSQKLYQWLFEPIEILKNNDLVKTLVFVPDGYLRNIPLGVLYDGKQYLVENFAIAVAPRLKLFTPQASANPLRVLTGGIGIAQTIEGTEFPQIDLVEKELTQIGGVVNTNSPLLNREFTEANIQQQLESGDFSAIHWKTHGVFSSDPTETFLVAYQDRIKADELQLLVAEATANGSNPLELLVLSACETARSDRRAVLGLAGITVRTGARSTLSTLWKANDRANTILMTEFYQQLAQPGMTKAEALRQAQLFLIAKKGYFAPHFWATYVLVGSWL